MASNYTNVLLYNITDDQSESVPLAGTPTGPDTKVAAQMELGRTAAARAEAGSVESALAHAVDLFITEHVENPYGSLGISAVNIPKCNLCCSSLL